MSNGRLERKAAEFLRTKRGTATYRDFARKLGITPSMLFRFEQCETSMTLETLQRIRARLGVSLADLFGREETLRPGRLRDL